MKKKALIYGLIAFFLFMPPRVRAAESAQPQRSGIDFSLEALKHLIEVKQIHSPEELLENLPKAVTENYQLVPKRYTLDPEVDLVGKDRSGNPFILYFPNSRGGSVRASFWDPKSQLIREVSILFPVHGQSRPVISEVESHDPIKPEYTNDKWPSLLETAARSAHLTPRSQPLRYAILGALLDCDNIEGFLPRNMQRVRQRKLRAGISELVAHTKGLLNQGLAEASAFREIAKYELKYGRYRSLFAPSKAALDEDGESPRDANADFISQIAKLRYVAADNFDQIYSSNVVPHGIATKSDLPNEKELFDLKSLVAGQLSVETGSKLDQNSQYACDLIRKRSLAAATQGQSKSGAAESGDASESENHGK